MVIFGELDSSSIYIYSTMFTVVIYSNGKFDSKLRYVSGEILRECISNRYTKNNC